MKRSEIVDCIRSVYGIPADIEENSTSRNRQDALLEEISSFFDANPKEEVISLVREVDECVKSEFLKPVALILLLSAYADRYGASAELLVVLHNWASGLGDQETASKHLRSLWPRHKDNYYVLWLWVQLHEPWVPPSVRLSNDFLVHEIKVLEMILALWPEDVLAKRLLERLQSTGFSLYSITNNEYTYDFPFPDPLSDLSVEELLKPMTEDHAHS